MKQEHDIQSKIVTCAKKLLHDQAKGNSNLLDSVLKQRFEFYTCVKEKVCDFKEANIRRKKNNVNFIFSA